MGGDLSFDLYPALDLSADQGKESLPAVFQKGGLEAGLRLGRGERLYAIYTRPGAGALFRILPLLNILRLFHSVLPHFPERKAKQGTVSLHRRHHRRPCPVRDCGRLGSLIPAARQDKPYETARGKRLKYIDI